MEVCIYDLFIHFFLLFVCIIYYPSKYIFNSLKIESHYHLVFRYTVFTVFSMFYLLNPHSSSNSIHIVDNTMYFCAKLKSTIEHLKTIKQQSIHITFIPQCYKSFHLWQFIRYSFHVSVCLSICLSVYFHVFLGTQEIYYNVAWFPATLPIDFNLHVCVNV